MKKSIEEGNIEVGDKIVPIKVNVVKINKEGNMENESKNVYGRQIGFNKIRDGETRRLMGEGVLRAMESDKYKSMERPKVIEELLLVDNTTGKEFYDTFTDAQLQNRLERLHTTRYFAQWHDYSTIGGHSHFLIMLHWLYNTQNYLTDQEFWSKFPDRRGESVQSIVERACIHVLARSS